MIFMSHLMPPVSKTCFKLVISLSVMVMTACSAQAAKLQQLASITAPAGKGILDTVKGSYTFTPRTCAIYTGDGINDIEIEGPGTAPDGEKFYFEFSSTGNAVTLKFGVDGRFTSAEKQLQAGQFVSQEFVVEVSEKIITIPSLALVDEQGQLVDANASLRINCGG